MISGLTLTATVSAQEYRPAVSLSSYSETEKTGFAFYHLINRDPPVEEWIQAREDYKKSNMDVRLKMMDAARLRLKDGFANYTPDQDLITVGMPLLFTMIDNPDYLTDRKAIDNGLIKRLQIRPPESKDQLYFPFQVGKLMIGVIPQDIDKLLSIDMSDAEYQDFCTRVTDCSNLKNKPIGVTIRLKPVKADAKEPIILDGGPVFLMMSEIAAVYIKDKNNRDVVWAYTAPWYSNGKTRELMTLFK